MPYYDKKFKRTVSNKLPIILTSYVSIEQVLEAMIISGSRNSQAKIFTYESVKHDFGLLRVNYTVQPRFGKDTYFFEKDNKILTVISCRNSLGENPLPNPQCRQIFEQDFADISISYDLDLLPNWRDYQDNVEILLSCLATDIRKSLPENIRR